MTRLLKSLLQQHGALLLLLSSSYGSSFEREGDNRVSAVFCPSNTTHIGWLTPSWQECVQHTRAEAVVESMEFLRKNLVSFDVGTAEALGFEKTDDRMAEDLRQLQADDESSSSSSSDDVKSERHVLPDGLSNGIVQDTIQIALDSKVDYYWTQSIPKDVYFEYVLAYSNVDEARNNWRPLLKEALAPTIQYLRRIRMMVNLETVVQEVNTRLWSSFSNVNNGSPITFKEGQTPLIYDPMSVILYGYASCTGLSILLVDALRTVGVPARIAGTPAWNGKIENGNHSWVEFYSTVTGTWKFIEAIATKNVRSYNPCDNWFCNKKHFDGKTKVYAAKMVKTDDTYFPMSWDASNHEVPGEDRTDDVTAICSKC